MIKENPIKIVSIRSGWKDKRGPLTKRIDFYRRCEMNGKQSKENAQTANDVSKMCTAIFLFLRSFLVK